MHFIRMLEMFPFHRGSAKSVKWKHEGIFVRPFEGAVLTIIFLSISE